MREIAAVTVGRSDFGAYRPIIRQLQSLDDVRLRVIVSGAHLREDFGLTWREIEDAGFPIFERIPSLCTGDTEEAIGRSIGEGVIGFSRLFSRFRPDILLVLGDRFDMFAAVAAALPFRIPVAHIHGGELTAGAIDDAIRHSISKMSHLHFVATEVYARRLRQLGEESWRISVTGAPALDAVSNFKPLDARELHTQFGINGASRSLLITFHPVTLETDQTGAHIDSLLNALTKVDVDCLFSYPNADTNHRVIIDRIEAYTRERPRCRLARNLGQRSYFSLMNAVSAMVGNSSSGIIEAASFKLPVVNIGSRQQGRVHPRNVIDCGYQTRDIVATIRNAVEPSFRRSLSGLSNPYGDGRAAERIAERLASVTLEPALTTKRFTDHVPGESR